MHLSTILAVIHVVIDSTPDPTAANALRAAQVLNLITGTSVIVAAIAAWFVYAAFQAQLREARLQKAIVVERAYFERRSDVPSPSEVAATLSLGDYQIHMNTLRAAVHETNNDHNVTAPLRKYLQRKRDEFGILHDYFQLAAYLYKRKLLDRDYFLNRMFDQIERANAVLQPWYAEYPTRSVEVLGIDYLMPLATAHKASILRPTDENGSRDVIAPEVAYLVPPIEEPPPTR